MPLKWIADLGLCDLSRHGVMKAIIKLKTGVSCAKLQLKWDRCHCKVLLYAHYMSIV